MSKTVLIQSFRDFDVPDWINICQDSVKDYAKQRGWDYLFMGDEFFELAPNWAREAVKNNNLCTISDICRLEWIKKLLEEYENVVWADIDILIMNPSVIEINFNESEGFAYELFFDSQGAHHGLNNSFMFFSRHSQLHERYLAASYENLKQADQVDRTALGSDLLRSFGIPDNRLIKGLNIVNLAASLRIHRNQLKKIPDYIANQSKYEIGAVNLCLNERSLIIPGEVAVYDALQLSVVRTLLNSP